jgi:hypothetical protein
VLQNGEGVDPRPYAPIAIPTPLGTPHHVDHVVRGNHVGWPVAPTVDPVTCSLAIRPVIGVGRYLTATDRWRTWQS